MVSTKEAGPARTTPAAWAALAGIGLLVAAAVQGSGRVPGHPVAALDRAGSIALFAGALGAYLAMWFFLFEAKCASPARGRPRHLPGLWFRILVACFLLTPLFAVLVAWAAVRYARNRTA